jgi:hypothetical protein
MRILFIIRADLYIRNYIESGAFQEIEDHDCYYIAADNIKKRDEIESKDGFVGYFKIDQIEIAKHIELLNVLMWKYRKKSSTFLWRFLILHWPFTSQWYRVRKKRNLLDPLVYLVKGLKYPILGSFPISMISIPLLKQRLKINRQIKSFLESIRPDLVVIPSSAYDPVGTDVALLKERFSYKTLFLIDNWDNISSKSIMWALPDHLAVWGQQTQQHAVSIHGMAHETVTPIGTPRFDSYFSHRETYSKRVYRFEYILMCGCAEPFDELTALKILDAELEKHPDIYRGIKIVYRPHPKLQKRECEDVFHVDAFKHVILDRQAEEYHYRAVDKSYQPNLNYYPSLMYNARLVIAPLTTMIIEALVCGKPVLALIYDDGIHYTSAHNTYRYYEHFKGVERIKGLFFCNARENLGKSVRQRIQSPTQFDRKDMLDSLKYFLYHDRLSYGKRLKNVVRSMMAQ